MDSDNMKSRQSVALLNWKGLAVAFGTFMGIYLALASLLASANMSFLWFNPGSFQILTSFYPVLTPTIQGAFLGLITGFLCGAFCGAILAMLYNWGSSLWN